MRCYCGTYDLNVDDATYVKEGRPMCHPRTCERVGARKEDAARQTSFFDDLGNEHDNVGEVYGRLRHDGHLVWTASRNRRYADI